MGSRVSWTRIGFCARQVGHHGGEDIDQDRLAVFLRRGEGGRVKRLPLGGLGRKRADQRDSGNDGSDEERAQAKTIGRILLNDQCQAAIAAAARGPPITLA